MITVLTVYDCFAISFGSAYFLFSKSCDKLLALVGNWFGANAEHKTDSAVTGVFATVFMLSTALGIASLFIVF